MDIDGEGSGEGTCWGLAVAGERSVGKEETYVINNKEFFKKWCFGKEHST